MNILIVDDSQLLQSRLNHALRKVNVNMNISQAITCREALEAFGPFTPDKIILDISLPDGSGIGLLQEFKKKDPSIQVIMFTNYPTDEFKKRCIELGADYFLDKSNMKELINIIYPAQAQN